MYKKTSLKNYRKKGKYHNVSTNYGGHCYQSKLEAKFAQDLDWRLKSGEIKAWTRQIPIQLEVNGFKICKYIMDFEIVHKDGSLEWVETKGYETEVWKIKWKLLEALLPTINPDVRLTLVKN